VGGGRDRERAEGWRGNRLGWVFSYELRPASVVWVLAKVLGVNQGTKRVAGQKEVLAAGEVPVQWVQGNGPWEPRAAVRNCSLCWCSASWPHPLPPPPPTHTYTYTLPPLLPTGEQQADLRRLERAQLVCATPTHWDMLSRRWKQRKAVQGVSLFMLDELHLIGGAKGPTMEVRGGVLRGSCLWLM
jgi:hypothetical protein